MLVYLLLDTQSRNFDNLLYFGHQLLEVFASAFDQLSQTIEA